MSDADTATAYGNTQTEFGGTYIDGDRLVVLFTGDVERHERALRGILEHPEYLVVRITSRTLADVRAAAARTKERLLPTGTDVGSVGIAVHEGEFVVEVALDPYSDERAADVRATTRPDPVVVLPRPRPRPL